MLKAVTKMDDAGMLISTGMTAKTAASFVGGKTIAAMGGGLTLATIIVMAMTTPPTKKEFLLALISTVVFSFAGGAAFIMYFNLQEWATSFFGLIAILGICFTCGLPGWAIVRSTFIYFEKNKKVPIDDVIKKARGKLQ